MQDYELYYWGLTSENNRSGPGLLYENRPTPRQFSFQP